MTNIFIDFVPVAQLLHVFPPPWNWSGGKRVALVRASFGVFVPPKLTQDCINFTKQLFCIV